MAIATVNAGDLIRASKINEMINALNNGSGGVSGLVGFGQLTASFTLPSGGIYVVLGTSSDAISSITSDIFWVATKKTTYSGGTTINRDCFYYMDTTYLHRIIYFRIS